MKKNQTILKDELVLFNADKSAVLTQLRKLRDELDISSEKLVSLKQEEADVKQNTKEATARLDEIRDRAVSFDKQLAEVTIELEDARDTANKLSVKNKQESKLHLGRIKNLSEKEEKLKAKIANLKTVYDKNANVIKDSLVESRKKLKQATDEYKSKMAELSEIKKSLDKAKAEDKKITKDRLKREDKLRVREKLVEIKEEGLSKREEDLGSMGSDMNILYGRLKELYAEVKPDIDLDKLITKA
jgi:chromosome segregation ATPase